MQSDRISLATVAECIRVQAFEMPGNEADERTAWLIAQAVALEAELDRIPGFEREAFLGSCGFGES